MNERTIRALVAEDEAPARDSLREYLAATPWIEIVAEAADGRTALALTEKHKPDLLFLDVQLPELSGLEVARQMSHPAEIVFTTAYDRFAVAAFEIGAIDYLVKPFGRERLAAAAERVRARFAQAGVAASDRVRSALASGPLARLFARHGDRIVPIPVEGILRIQAQGDYAEVHAAQGVFLLHVALGGAGGAASIRSASGRCTVPTSSTSTRSSTCGPSTTGASRSRCATATVVVASRAASEELRRLAR